MLSKFRRKSGGFTLIELMIVIAIIAILAAILVPNFIRARAQGQLTACKSNLKNIGTAAEMYSTDWSGKYSGNYTLLTPNYLKVGPECPTAGSDTYSGNWKTGPNVIGNTVAPIYTDYYYVSCGTDVHLSVAVTGAYPAYNGVTGLIERAP